MKFLKDKDLLSENHWRQRPRVNKEWPVAELLSRASDAGLSPSLSAGCAHVVEVAGARIAAGVLCWQAEEAEEEAGEVGAALTYICT